MNSWHTPRQRLAVLLALLFLAGCFGGGTKVVRSEAQSRADTLLKRAIRAEQKGEAAEADRLFREALTISSSIEDTPAKAVELINLARLSRLHNDLAAAAAAIDAALALLTSQGNLYSEAAHEKALICLAGGDPATALTWAQRAAAAETGTSLGRRLNLVGRIFLAQGEWLKAGQTVKRALEENRGDNNREERANSLRMLGILARHGNDPDGAEQLLKEALGIDKQIGASAKIAADLEELAATARAAGDHNKTARYLERASDVHYNAGRFGAAGVAQSALADLFSQLGDGSRAEASRAKARELAERASAQKPTTPPATTSPSSSP
ncbi:tetratricopeptide repeat protein [Geobacter sp. FeAm09]|uniref:tetratricopeptide repeat protein n=1 Tax=Geobacter sp. FeAm09 TaxID=2597769 RepID=UPI0011EE44FC|nr:tetratricopeptide repeat protein [Geobacter sp. FeAm09]QEM68471.1 tetratricopeptide repeat protein [Geobacter sp. FeAm09]